MPIREYVPLMSAAVVVSPSAWQKLKSFLRRK